MEKVIGLKFILNRDHNIKSRSPIFDKLEGLQYIKPRQKLIVRVKRPRSQIIDNFNDESILSVPRQLSPSENKYFQDQNSNKDPYFQLISEKFTELYCHNSTENLKSNQRLTPLRIYNRTNFDRIFSEEYDKRDDLRITGTSATLSRSKGKRNDKNNFHTNFYQKLGALTKVVIIKKRKALVRK
ncbi:hypothetical protein SteCoe_270 [Stentor coeruleus]|uniref:Uncharacterized protein n=1 Tax=Stentor coeruleus TaxID=5963 RepID=A0A1R2D4A3_9CILI|nr:hypothetical protein SteCoe_270 [Stentor coeruleus]